MLLKLGTIMNLNITSTWISFWFVFLKSIHCVTTWTTLTSDPIVTIEPHCCGPTQFEAFRFDTDGFIQSLEHYVSLTETDGWYHYDFNNKRLAVEQNRWNATTNVTENHNVIIDFRQRLKWTLDGSQCKQERYLIPMTPPCIPGDATFVRAKNVSGIRAEVWQREETLSGRKRIYTVTSNTCQLLSLTSLSQQGVVTFSMTVFDNITRGITNDDVFTLPPSCLLTLDVRWR